MADKAWKAWERLVGGTLSRWLSTPWIKSGRDDLICRQALYGRMVERKYGDMAIHPDCPEKWRKAAMWFMTTFHVDAKNRAKFRIPSLLTNPLHEFWKWWAKLTHEAAMAGGKKRLMVLLAKPGNEHLLVIGMRELMWISDLLGKGWDFPMFTLQRRGTLPEDEEKLFICQFEEFLKFADAQLLLCPGPDGGSKHETPDVAAEGVRGGNAGPAGSEGGAPAPVRGEGKDA